MKVTIEVSAREERWLRIDMREHTFPDRLPYPRLAARILAAIEKQKGGSHE